jgi:NTE family protein
VSEFERRMIATFPPMAQYARSKVRQGKDRLRRTRSIGITVLAVDASETRLLDHGRSKTTGTESTNVDLESTPLPRWDLADLRRSGDVGLNSDRSTLRKWLAEAPFTLAMSAGFFGFFAHSGVLSALEDAGLAPERVAGASAGALVGGLWAAGLDAHEISRQLMALRREEFWDPGFGLGLLRGERFRERLDAVLPVREFARCRVPAAISAYDVLERRTRIITSGLLAPAIRASCAFPGLFQPAWDAGRPFLDGGILDRAGLAGIAPGTRVLHHHLVPRSSWLRRRSSTLSPPDGVAVLSLSMEGLPPLGPFRLAQGEQAMRVARRGIVDALDCPIAMSCGSV